MTASPNGATFVIAALVALGFGGVVWLAGVVTDTVIAYRRIRQARAIILPTRVRP